jgi:hypothetical protein
MKTLELAELLDCFTRTRQHAQNVEPNLAVLLFVMHRVMSPTVLLSGRHWPTVTRSPSSTRNAGLTWAAKFLCRFSYREYFGMKWRYSRRMTIVRCILVEMTVPVRMRPRIDTLHGN